MQAHNSTVQEFLGSAKTVFVVPVYQRNYGWLEDQCKRLFDDILYVIETKKEHFMGTVCFHIEDMNVRSVIDGQQRVTSFMLLLKAMMDFVSEKDIKADIRDTYLLNRVRGTDNFLKVKLHLNKHDDAVYKLLLESTHKNITGRLRRDQLSSRVYQNYLLFYDLVESYVGSGGSVDDILMSFGLLTIVALEIQSENPQEIFESLNSTGLDLTNVDLLRNYFLMKFPYDFQLKLYDSYWSRIEELVGCANMAQFFVDYLIFRRKYHYIHLNGRRMHVTTGCLLDAYKGYYDLLDSSDSDEIRVESMFADMTYCAEIYKSFLFEESVDLAAESHMRQLLYFLIDVNSCTACRVLLLYLFDLRAQQFITDDVLYVCVSGILSFVFRGRVRGRLSMTDQFCVSVLNNLSEVVDYSDFLDTFWKAITCGRGSFSFSSDEEFYECLVHNDIYSRLRSRGVKYFLYALEMNSDFAKGLPRFDDEFISVEHIMPQTLSSQWNEYLSQDTKERYADLVHVCGNLALTNYNSEMSNKLFDDKQVFYKDSNFHYTRQLSQYSRWSAINVESRSRALASAALKVWTLPPEYQSTHVIASSLHDLDADFEQFVSTKPLVFCIGNVDYNVTSWLSMLSSVVQYFNDEDHAVFVKSVKMSGVSLVVFDDGRGVDAANYKAVGPNVFVKKKVSSTGVLTAIRKLVIEFDKIAGTDYEHNFLFQLQ